MKKIKRYSQFLESYSIDGKICDEFVALFNDDSLEKLPGLIGDQVLNTKVKSSTDISFADLKNYPIIYEYIKEIDLCCQDYMKTYPSLNYYQSWGIIEPPNIQKYSPNEGFYQEHFERSSHTFPESHRILGWLTYLNDVEKAGTEFIYQKVKTQAKKGDTIFFPVDFTFLHKGMISKKEDKYIIAGWYNFLNKGEEDSSPFKISEIFGSLKKIFTLKK